MIRTTTTSGSTGLGWLTAFRECVMSCAATSSAVIRSMSGISWSIAARSSAWCRRALGRLAGRTASAVLPAARFLTLSLVAGFGLGLFFGGCSLATRLTGKVLPRPPAHNFGDPATVVDGASRR
jgi:hypothetical protein